MLSLQLQNLIICIFIWSGIKVDLGSFILLMKLKSNKDHYQGQNESWKSAIYILQGLLLKCHISFFFKSKGFEIFTTSTYATLASTLKISAQNNDFWPLYRCIKDCWMVYWHFKNFHVHAGLRGLWLGTWWIRGELRLILGNEEVLGLVLVWRDWYHDV